MTYDLLAEIEQDTLLKRTSSSRGGQYNGPCPWCGGADRFRVQPNFGPYGFFACNQCQRSGSAIDYLMLRRRYSKRQALAAVGWEPRDGGRHTQGMQVYSLGSHPEWEEPLEQWQRAALAFAKECQRALWSECGRPALDYLRGRGLTDETIRKAALGYHSGAFRAPAKVWVRSIWLAQGIVIPWLIEGSIWRLSIRDERVVEGERRYRQVSGGSNGLYLAEGLWRLKRQAAVLVEGELDALSVAQECSDLVAVVATGTTKGSRSPRWISLLSQQERVLVAFDAEREKGDADARWWIQRLENAERLRPLWKDANQMLSDGADMRAWIGAALVKPQLPAAGPIKESGAAIDEVPMEVRPLRLAQHKLPSMLPAHTAPVSRRQNCCPFEHAVADRQGHVRATPCQGEPLPGSNWCAEHQQAQVLLDVGAQLGYPRIRLTRHRTIGSGRGSWQAYACRAPARWIYHDLVVIRSLVSSHNGNSGSVDQAENWPATG